MTKRVTNKLIIKIVPFFILFLSCSKLMAQDSICYFNKNWEKTSKDDALFYRLKPLKLKAKDILGSKVKVDSIFLIKDYYIENDSLQFQGYALDREAKHLIGNAVWYGSKGRIIEEKEYYNSDLEYYDPNLKYYNSNLEYKIYEPPHSALNVGYHYIGKAKSAGYIGFDIRCNNSHVPPFNIGLGTYLTGIDNNFSILPAIQTNYSINNSYLIELSSSNKFFKPSLGLNLLNAIQVKMGYNFWYNDTHFDAFSFGINLCIGDNDFYDYFKIGF
jgi:hypothetical protein